MKKILIFIFLLILSFTSFNTVIAEEQPEIKYFYSPTCSHCQDVDAFLKSQGFYDKYNIVKYNTVDPETARTYTETLDRLNVPLTDRGVPMIIMNDAYLYGSGAIPKNFSYFAEQYAQGKLEATGDLSNITPGEESKNSNETPKKKANTTLTIGAILGAGLVDSINPCAFAVLIFLATYLLSIGSKKKTLKIGLTYIVTVFIVYLLAGFGLFKIIDAFNVASYIRTIAGVILILLAAISFKGFFFPNGKTILAIPESKRPIIERYIKKATLPAAIILGGLVALFELPCTGGVYLAIISLLADSATKLNAFLYLVLYNIIFVLPLVVILLIIHYGYSADIIEKWRQDNKKWMRLAIGILMLAIGILMILRII